MTFDEIKQRIVVLTQQAEQSAGQHNLNLGALAEAKAALAYMEGKAKEALEAAEKIVKDAVATEAEKALAPSTPNAAEAAVAADAASVSAPVAAA